ncbi:MAG TPA: efflux RND transporter periplasmic adaptor subunit [Salinimicrobium sp.]|nr:efflux RND transporter periplasmic adaptor subunit [Salinimicrobium sp.]
MKRIYILLILGAFFISCGNDEKSVEEVINDGDLSEIRAKKAELSAQQSEISAKMAELDKAIRSLDKNKSFALVGTTIVQDTAFNHYVEIPGDVATDQNITIYPQYAGVLRQVLVEEGQKVNKGQVLARIDDGGLSSQLAQLQVQEALAKTTFERQQRLWEQKIGSEIQFLEAKANYEAVQNSVNQLRSQLGKTVVNAPFSGIIDEIFTDQGEVVAPGQSRLFRLVNLSEMYITASVPESYLGKIQKGTDVMVEIPAAGVEFKSEVKQVGNFINPSNRTFEIKVAVPGDQKMIKPNLIASVKINDYSAENAIVIPEHVIQQNAAGEKVAYVVEAENDSIGMARKRIITTGSNYQDSIEVLKGIKAGEILIVEGAKNVQDGQRVKFNQGQQ